jgi:hypothetical protein
MIMRIAAWPSCSRSVCSRTPLDALAFRDVADDADDAKRDARRVAEDLPPRMDPAQLPALAAKQPVFEFVA